jgi:hypothetical protein
MMKPVTALILLMAMLIILTSLPNDQSSGFKSLADEKDRNCIENVVCHDISEFRRSTQGDAYPYEHCICHSEIPDSGTLIEVKGPRTVEPGEEVTYTLVIYGGPGLTFGFGINATNGTLNKNFQFAPQEDNEFEIEYTAPESEQTVFITFVGLSGDGDLEVQPKTNETAGDTWNLNKITIDVKHRQTVSDGDSPTLFYLTIILVVTVIVVVILVKVTTSKSKQK